MKFHAALAALLMAASASFAATPPVLQTGLVTPGHPVMWTTTGVIQDAGTSSAGLLTGLGITSSSLQSFGINSALTGAHQELSFGANASGAQIGITALNGAAQEPINFVVNGVTQLTISAAGVSGNYNVTGANISSLNIAQTGGTLPQPSIVTLTRTGSVFNDGSPLMTTTWTINNNAGSGSPALNQTINRTIIQNNPQQGAWANFDTLEFDGTSSSLGGDLIARYMQMLLNDDMGSNVNSAKGWASIASVVDATGHASSVAGLLRVMEFDMEVSGLDDMSGLSGREILSLVGSPGRNYVGTDSQITHAINIDQEGGTSGKFRYIDTMHIGGSYSDAALYIDAVPDNGVAPAIAIVSGRKISLNHPTDTAELLYNGNVIVSSMPTRMPGYALSALPAITAANQGGLAFCNDCTNLDETSGNGKGVIVTMNVNGGWRSPWGGAASNVAPILSAAGAVTFSGLSTTPGGKQPLCVDTATGVVYKGSGGAC